MLLGFGGDSLITCTGRSSSAAGQGRIHRSKISINNMILAYLTGNCRYCKCFNTLVT